MKFTLIGLEFTLIGLGLALLLWGFGFMTGRKWEADAGRAQNAEKPTQDECYATWKPTPESVQFYSIFPCPPLDGKDGSAQYIPIPRGSALAFDSAVDIGWRVEKDGTEVFVCGGKDVLRRSAEGRLVVP